MKQLKMMTVAGQAARHNCTQLTVNNTGRYLESPVEQFISVICLEENRISSILILYFNTHN